MGSSGASLKFVHGRYVIEIEATIRIPVEFEALTATEVRTGVRLTPRERKVLGGLLQGMRNKEVAAAMLISERMVKFHVSRLLQKFKVADRCELQAVFAGQKAAKV